MVKLTVFSTVIVDVETSSSSLVIVVLTVVVGVGWYQTGSQRTGVKPADVGWVTVAVAGMILSAVMV